jgi:hypothetical protein
MVMARLAIKLSALAPAGHHLGVFSRGADSRDAAVTYFDLLERVQSGLRLPSGLWQRVCRATPADARMPASGAAFQGCIRPAGTLQADPPRGTGQAAESCGLPLSARFSHHFFNGLTDHSWPGLRWLQSDAQL